ncbi:MAG: UDP-N-acetylmuramate--L-alanine ligase [Candidatus Babeliaceae bacterium]|jgi:UDP-N-acetylmuramate--alanine ligase
MYNKKAHIHFIGIGGIGMSGIATILHYQGYTISGCDLDLEQKSIENLRALGCQIYKGNNTAHCHDASINILVYSSAIKPHDPEIVAAQQRGIPTISRALMLAELMRTKYSIAIAGAHGKTTTTSLISHILIEAHKDPTVIIGGHLKNISTNARFGKGDFLVAEADESDKSFLHLYPTLAVVTNIDLEHLDVYTDLADIQKAFLHFLSNIPFYGKAIVCYDDSNLQKILPLPHIKTVSYGLNPAADIYATDIVLEKDYSTFSVWLKNNNQALGTITLAMPGKHNILNALAALAITRDIGIPFNEIAHALANFKGIERRFSHKGTSYHGAEIFDDYGHHPTEIYNTLLVARKKAHNKLIVVFQPHRYTRTQALWKDFLQVFATSSIDHLIITDIYAASESPIDTITSQRLVEELRSCNPTCTVSYEPLEDAFVSIKNNVDAVMHEGDLLLLLGAGKVNKLAHYLV